VTDPSDERVSEPTTAPAPQAPEPESTGSLRALAALLGLALAFAAAVLIGLAVDTADRPTIEECRTGAVEIPADGDCFDGGSAQQNLTVGFLGLGGLLGAAGVVVCLFVAASASGSRWMLPITAGAIIFGAAGIIAANV
jgi:hypothetical protein